MKVVSVKHLLNARSHPGPLARGENSPISGSRLEPQNRSRQREEADFLAPRTLPPPHVGGYNRQVHGEGGCFTIQSERAYVGRHRSA